MSFDKQFVRDYLETLDWDKTPPGPQLPADVVAKTCAKLSGGLRKLDRGKNFDAYARQRFSTIPAPRTRAVGQHGENLRRAARQFTAWAAKQNLTDWKQVELKHLMAFLQHERGAPARLMTRKKSNTASQQRKCLSRNRRLARLL